MLVSLIWFHYALPSLLGIEISAPVAVRTYKYFLRTNKFSKYLSAPKQTHVHLSHQSRWRTN
ncbi:hypothetical protein BN77_p2150007 [Rhizobium mesoamericanum STM3625]|uniref:Uncharacterized protein n=1 Tax=Rhizobium mesoamericanum STM3625 TaxID=1211777 RepID=K0Q6J6_9HYPH|nr:hypothetical protein BN77_p2150007 [Rhizobium mesoamericanum STM3625]